MGQEIERKFLLAGESWRQAAGDGTFYRQGYLATEADRNVRVRTKSERALLTIKGRSHGEEGLTHLEYEYEIPLADAEEILEELCERPLIEKVRYKIDYRGLVWEVDEFHGDNQGLVVAEVELESPDQPFEAPPSVGEEVSDDPRYLNANLVRAPYGSW